MTKTIDVQQFKRADSVIIAETEVYALTPLVPKICCVLRRAKRSFPMINRVTRTLRAMVSEKYETPKLTLARAQKLLPGNVSFAIVKHPITAEASLRVHAIRTQEQLTNRSQQ
jgi:hypothetical protein